MSLVIFQVQIEHRDRSYTKWIDRNPEKTHHHWREIARITKKWSVYHLLEGYRTYDRQWSNMNLQVTLTRRCLLLKQIVAAARNRKIIRGCLQQEEGLVMNLPTQRRLPAAVNQQLPLLLPVITKDKLTLVQRWQCHRAFTQGATSSVHRFPILIRSENN